MKLTLIRYHYLVYEPDSNFACCPINVLNRDILKVRSRVRFTCRAHFFKASFIICAAVFDTLNEKAALGAVILVSFLSFPQRYCHSSMCIVTQNLSDR